MWNGERTGVGSSKPSSGTLRFSEPRRALDCAVWGTTTTGGRREAVGFSCIDDEDTSEDEVEGEQGTEL